MTQPYFLALIAGALCLAAHDEARALQPTREGPNRNVWLCTYGATGDVEYWNAVETDLSRREAAEQIDSYAKSIGAPGGGCYDRTGNFGEAPFESVGAAEATQNASIQNWYMNRYSRVDWTPRPAEMLSSPRQTATVAFRDPSASIREKGYSNNTFEVDYQFIPCMGELHIAYSVVENSVRSKDPTYYLDGVYYRVSAPRPEILSVPLTGKVWMEPYVDRIIGKFADDAAAKALGFGCFDGQTKRIAKLDNLTNDMGKAVAKDELPKILERLRVTFETTELAASTAAENEIKTGLAQKAVDESERSGQAGLDRAAQERAKRNAEREARFAAEQAKYREELAAQQKAVADFEAARRQVEADKAAAAAKVAAAQAAFAQQQAAHQAELDRHAKAQAEYEAKLAGQPH